MNNDFRPIRGQQEMDSLLEIVFKNNEEVSLWQYHQNERNIFRTTIASFNPTEHTLQLKTNSDLKLHANQPLYFHTETRSLTFKTTHFSHHENLLDLRYPYIKDSIFKDLRSHNRYEMEAMAVFHVDARSFKMHNRENIKLSIIDLSLGGISLEIKRNQSHLIDISDELIFKSLHQTTLEKFKAEVVSIMPFENESLKIGIKFNKHLTEDSLNRILIDL